MDKIARIHHEDQPPLDGNDPYPAQEKWQQGAQAGVARDEEDRDSGAYPRGNAPLVK
jgi:hypothetical protein